VEKNSKKGLTDHVEIAVAVMEHDDDSYDKFLQPIFSPIEASWKSGKAFVLPVDDKGTAYGWKIINESVLDLYPALFYFDNSDWSITSYYHPSTARGIVDPPLIGFRYLPVGFGDSGTVPHTFLLRDKQDVDVGILKLFLSQEHVDFSDVAQSTPFVPLQVGARGTVPTTSIVKPTKLRFLWDTILVPVVQRRASALVRAESEAAVQTD
jgi:hypothetical protein